MKDRVENFTLGDFNFHVYSIGTEGGQIRGIEITDALGEIEKIGFNGKLSITFTDPHIIKDEGFRYKNEKNIDNLKTMCKLILDEINNSKLK